MPTSTTSARRLRRPIPLDPEGFLEATDGLTSAEVGGLVILAAAWWPAGVLPERPADCARALGIEAGHAARMVERLRPHFAAGSYFGILRTAHLAKAERRAKAGRRGMAVRWHGGADVSQYH